MLIVKRAEFGGFFSIKNKYLFHLPPSTVIEQSWWYGIWISNPVQGG
jgi:hypothetical protein